MNKCETTDERIMKEKILWKKLAAKYDRQNSTYEEAYKLSIKKFGFSSFHASTQVIFFLILFTFTEIEAGLFHTPNNSTVMESTPVLGDAISAALLS